MICQTLNIGQPNRAFSNFANVALLEFEDQLCEGLDDVKDCQAGIAIDVFDWQLGRVNPVDQELAGGHANSGVLASETLFGLEHAIEQNEPIFGFFDEHQVNQRFWCLLSWPLG